MTHDNLYSRPDLYDLMAPADPDMEALYVAEALARPGPVLELACGSGRFTLPLARTGRRVVAGDLSEVMLAAAGRAAQDAGLAIETHRLDMRDFRLPGERFDTIVVAANSLLHLTDIADFDGFFRSVREHLAPGGRLAFDVFAPSLRLLTRDPTERFPLGEAIHATLGRVIVEESIDYDAVRQVSRITWFWSTAGQPDFHLSRFEMRQVFPQELPLLIARGGLRLVERFGDFDRSAFTAASFRQVCLCAVA